METGAIRVLVIDDTDHVRKMLNTMLEVDGFEVVGAEHRDPDAAIEAVEALDPHVVVLDYRMPGLNGLEAAARIRNRRPEQLVIVYTAFIDDALERAAAESGIALCLGKVEGLQLLEQEIRRLVGTQS